MCCVMPCVVACRYQSFRLFPGQVVAVTATNPSGGRLLATVGAHCGSLRRWRRPQSTQLATFAAAATGACTCLSPWSLTGDNCPAGYAVQATNIATCRRMLANSIGCVWSLTSLPNAEDIGLITSH